MVERESLGFGVRVRWGRVGLFYGITLVLTLLATLAWRHAGGSFQGTSAALVLNLCMLLPGAVAVVLVRWFFREPLRETLGLRRPPLRWLSIAWGLAAVVMLLALGVALSMPGLEFSTDLTGLAAAGMSDAEIQSLRARLPTSSAGAVGALLAQGLVLGPTACLLGGLGEELGWRGFLQRELAPFGEWRSSAAVGLLWGVWHLPAVFQGYGYPKHPWIGSLLLLGLTQVLAPLYARLRERSGSIFVPAVFHGTCGGTSLLAIAFVRGGSELSTGFTGLAGLVAATLTSAAFLAITAARGNDPSR